MEIVETEMNKSFDWSIYTNSSESDTSQIENEIEAEWKEVNGEGIEVAPIRGDFIADD